jgi:hypothetical protein
VSEPLKPLNFDCNADPDPAFLSYADPDPDPASQNNAYRVPYFADPDPQPCFRYRCIILSFFLVFCIDIHRILVRITDLGFLVKLDPGVWWKKFENLKLKDFQS